ncbi:MAG: helix-turn-helix transcriptional regulator [Rickettsiales bacterium]|nr:helix-turn-helix transcriptional regulator [Rickettsiales bacterium]
MAAIQENLKKLMKEKNVSAYRLANEIGMGDSVIRDILRGRSKSPRIETINKIAIGLGVTTADIIGAESSNEPPFDAKLYTKAVLSVTKVVEENYDNNDEYEVMTRAINDVVKDVYAIMTNGESEDGEVNPYVIKLLLEKHRI